jgi:hypothetical protein
MSINNDFILSQITPQGDTLPSLVETREGEHVAFLAAQLIKVLDIELSTGATEFDIYQSIVSIMKTDFLDFEITDKIKELTAELCARGGTALFRRIAKKQASLTKAMKETPYAVSTGSPSVDKDGYYEVSDEEAASGIDLDLDSILDSTRPTLDSFQKSLQQAVEMLKGEVTTLPPTLSDKTGSGDPALPQLFQNRDDELRATLGNIFDGVGALETAPFDALTIADKIDIALRRCLNAAYEFTGNSTLEVNNYLEILSEFSENENDFKDKLYNSVLNVFDYVQNHSLKSFGLTSDFAHLRLSQIIPNYFLKTQGYVLDTSACSSGKTGTILLAPVETDSKRTIVVVENNTYNDIFDQFQKWYSSRSDFQILHKRDFWVDRWMKSDIKTIVVLDKAFLARINEKQRVTIGLESFNSYIKRSGLDLLIVDEVHNYKGSSSGETLKIIHGDQDQDIDDDAHNNCSYATHTMAVNAPHRLFCSATPLLNDFTELAKILQMVLPTNTPEDKNQRHQALLNDCNDSAKSTNNIIQKTSLIYTPLQLVSTRVPRPSINYDIKTINNSSNTYETYGESVRQLIADKEEMHSSNKFGFYWSDIAQDELFFGLYLNLLKPQILRSIRLGHQICLYTNQSCQSHEPLKAQLLEMIQNAGLELEDDEVVVANGSTSTILRKATPIRVDDGSVVEKTALAEMVWKKQCRVLIANNVISVGLDGLQGSDRVQGCGRIQDVYLLANPYTEAIFYQLKSRFVRTQGEDCTEFPHVSFYQPYIWFDASQEGQNTYLYSRTNQTTKRLELKGIKSDLVLDGKFPEGIDINNLNNEMSDLFFKQFREGSFETDEAEVTREELMEEICSERLAV